MSDSVLLGGDPALQAASFTRLILPFAYSPILVPAPSTGASWREMEPGSGANGIDLGCGETTRAQRVRYFTAETAEVLFGTRSKRFRLQAVYPAVAPLRVSSPELLLFEFDLPSPKLKPSPLRQGLLILEFSVPGATSLKQLCRFNELVRYFRRPHAAFNQQLRLWNFLSAWLGPCPAASRRDLLAPWLALLEKPLMLTGSTQVLRLWPKCWSERARLWADGQFIGFDPDSRNCDECDHLWRRDPLPHQPMILPDDRAFVWTAGVWNKQDPSTPPPVQTESAGWHALLNVDSLYDPANNSIDRPFIKDFVGQHSYLRWAPDSLYGFTPHSGVALVPDMANPPLWQHFRCLYLDQACLLLYLRSTLFAFSREISRISRAMQGAGKKLKRQAVGDFMQLEREFSLFTNLYQFPLLSHQQQGVEIYVQQRKALNIDNFYLEVQAEIHHMDEMLDRRNDRTIRVLGIAIAVIATAGVLWDDFGLLGLLQGETASRGWQMAIVAAGVLALWGLCLWFVRWYENR